MRYLISSALLCVLAACGSAGSSTLEPGQWEMNIAVTKMDMPGLPAGTNVPMPPPTRQSQCLTPEQARNPGAGFAAGGDSGCTSEDYRMEGGRISGTLQCSQPTGNMRATVNGTYTAESMDMTMNSEVSAGGQTVNMESRVTGRRTGECSN